MKAAFRGVPVAALYWPTLGESSDTSSTWAWAGPAVTATVSTTTRAPDRGIRHECVWLRITDVSSLGRLRAVGLRYNDDADVPGAQTERRGEAGLVRGLFRSGASSPAFVVGQRPAVNTQSSRGQRRRRCSRRRTFSAL